jgi:hypothetical protein
MVDRTILEELKRNISAQDAQFMRKSMGYIRREYEVPYPRSYAPEIVDL